MAVFSFPKPPQLRYFRHKLCRRILLIGTLLAASPFFPRAAQQAKPAAKAPATSAQPAATALLAVLFSAYWEEQAQLFPLSATAQGDNRYNDQRPDPGLSDAAASFLPALLRVAAQHRPPTTQRQDQTNHDIFDYELQLRLDGLKRNARLMPFAQFYSLPNTLVQLGAGPGAKPFKTVPGYDN